MGVVPRLRESFSKCAFSLSFRRGRAVVQRGRPFAVRRSLAAADQNVATSVESEISTELVPAPVVEDYAERCANSVTLSGIAMERPEERRARDDVEWAVLNLAVPQYPRRKETSYDVFRATFFKVMAKQVSQYVDKGTKLVIQGRLSKYRGQCSVVVDDFAVLSDGTWPFTQPLPDKSTRMNSDRRTITDSFLRPSQERVYADYVQGVSVEEIGKSRTLKKATVLSYLADAAFHGKEVDFEWLARQCLLGPPQSKFMKTDTVCAAIKEIMSKEGIEDLADVPVRETHELLRATESGQPFKVQEELINSVTYSQMKTVLAMMRQDRGPDDWNKFTVHETYREAGDTSSPEAPY